jgi:hypothetical protein
MVPGIHHIFGIIWSKCNVIVVYIFKSICGGSYMFIFCFRSRNRTRSRGIIENRSWEVITTFFTVQNMKALQSQNGSRKQCCGSGFIKCGSGSSISSESGFGSGSGSRVLMIKNRKKYSLKFLPSGFGLRIRIHGPHWIWIRIRIRIRNTGSRDTFYTVSIHLGIFFALLHLRHNAYIMDDILCTYIFTV